MNNREHVCLPNFRSTSRHTKDFIESPMSEICHASTTSQPSSNNPSLLLDDQADLKAGRLPAAAAQLFPASKQAKSKEPKPKRRRV